MKAAPLLWALVLPLGAAGGWVAHSPYRATDAFRDAALRHDAAALNARIDYPRLRAALKESLNRTMAEQLLGHKTDDGMNMLAMMFAGALVAPMVDRLVTPEGLALLLAAGTPSTTGDPLAGAERAPAGQLLSERHYLDRNHFELVVSRRDHPAAHVHFHFERRGLTDWTLVGISLPDFAKS